jgi:hypothetical protein
MLPFVITMIGIDAWHAVQQVVVHTLFHLLIYIIEAIVQHCVPLMIKCYTVLAQNVVI